MNMYGSLNNTGEPPTTSPAKNRVDDAGVVRHVSRRRHISKEELLQEQEREDDKGLQRGGCATSCINRGRGGRVC